MPTTLEQNVGPILAGEGNNDGPVRQAKTGELVLSQVHGRYYETTSRGNVYVTSNQTGVTMPAGLSTAPTTVTLFNPYGSGVYGVIIYGGVTLTVVNVAAAVIWVGMNTNSVAAATTGTAATVRNCLVGNNKISQIFAFTAATLPAAPVAGPTLGAGLTGAITTIPGMMPYGREFAGSLVMLPGASLSFQASTASGASSAFGEWIWEEVPIV